MILLKYTVAELISIKFLKFLKNTYQYQREKGRDLTQFYNKNPYIKRKKAK